MISDSLRHLQQDAMNLGLLFIQQPDELIVLLDSFKRFNKDGLPAGTCAMHDALHPPFLFNLHGDDKALSANCDQFILHSSAFGQAAQVTAERLLNLTTLFFSFAANSR